MFMLFRQIYFVKMLADFVLPTPVCNIYYIASISL